MSNEEKHAWTGRYCGECMHLQHSNDDACWCNPLYTQDMGHEEAAEGYTETATGAPACTKFIPSIAAQQLEQMKRLNDFLGNSVGSHGFIAVEMFGPYGG